METFEAFTADISIKKAEFRTGMKGDLFLLGYFNTTKELEKRGVNAAIFKDLNMRENVGKGAKLRMEFNSEAVPTVKEVLRKPTFETAVPSLCPSCGSSLKVSESGLHCENRVCPATSRGFIYQILRQAAPDTSEKLFDVYLDGYVYNQAQNVIDNPYEFMVMFNQITDHNTEARLGQWKSFYGNNAEILHKVDVALQNWFRLDKYSTRSFWTICNFPGLTEEELDTLCLVSPLEVLDGTYKKKIFSKSKRCGKLLDENKDFIIFLKSWFFKYGEKVWQKEVTLEKI